jgi:hypothetical protein
MSTVSASCSARTSSSVTMRISWTPDSSSFRYRALLTVGSRSTYVSLGNSGTSTGTATITGLSANTSYSWSVVIQYYDSSWKTGGARDSGTIMTYNLSPVISSAAYSNGYVTVSWSQAHGGNASTISARVFVSNGSSTIASADVTAGGSGNNSYSTRVSVGKLTSGTYYVNVISFNSAASYDGWYASAGRVSFTVVTYMPWSWTKAADSYNESNGSASYSQLVSACSAVTGKGKISDFSHTVFNDLCRWVNAVLTQAGNAWSSSYASYSATLMTESDRVLTAVRFNSLSYNAKRACTALTKTISFTARAKGEKVSGSFFTALVNNLNSAISES